MRDAFVDVRLEIPLAELAVLADPERVILERLRASIAFIGCNGVDARRGVTNINLPEAEVKRAMLLAARRRVVVADGSKLGEVELAKVCDMREGGLVISDGTADPAIVAEISSAGCPVEIAD